MPVFGDLGLDPVAACWTIKGVRFAADVRFRQILVTGPPGSGKTTLINRIGGWPDEGYVDLSLEGWWKAQSLALRPREVHTGVPFVGREAALALFDADWLAAAQRLRIDFDRIRLPPPKRSLFSVDWRARFAFEFLLPEPGTLYRLRQERARRGTHRVDERLDLDQIRQQVEVSAQIALYLHRKGMLVHVRQSFEGAPCRIAA